MRKCYVFSGKNYSLGSTIMNLGSHVAFCFVNVTQAHGGGGGEIKNVLRRDE